MLIEKRIKYYGISINLILTVQHDNAAHVSSLLSGGAGNGASTEVEGGRGKRQTWNANVVIS